MPISRDPKQRAKQIAQLRPPMKKGEAPRGKRKSPDEKSKTRGKYNVKSFKDILDKIGSQDLLSDPLIDRKIKKKFFEGGPIQKKDAVGHIVYHKALKGDLWALRFVAEYTDGKPKEHVTIVDKTVTVDIEDCNYEEPEMVEEFGVDGNIDTANNTNL